MDFKSIKDKIVKASITAKDKIVTTKDKAVNYSAKKLSKSGATIRDKKGLLETIQKSKNTTSVNKETGKKKTHKMRTIIIFASEKSDFFKDALVQYPILVTKAFSQNITLKLAISNIEGVNYEDFNIKKMPSLVVFENNKPIKTIEGKQNIQKLVKSFNLDINKQVETL